MKLTSSDRARFMPGELQRWRLKSHGRVVKSNTLPTENELFHLDSVVRGEPGWIALALDFDTRLDQRDIELATAAIFARHDVLRGHFVGHAGGYDRYVHEHVDVERIMEGADGCSAAKTDAGFTESIMAEITRACSPLRPGAHYAAAIRRETSTTLIYAFDHCYVDARSLAVLAAEIPGLIAEREVARPESGLCVIERRAAHDVAVSHTDPRLLGWETFFEESGWSVPEFPLDLGVAYGHTAPTYTQVRTLRSASEAVEFSEVSRQFGGRSYSALLTCAGIAIRQAGGPAEMPVIIPTGGHLQGQQCVAWLVGNAPVRISCSGENVPAAVARNTQRLSAALPLAEIGLTPVYRAYGDRLQRGRRDVFMMSYVDYTRLPEAPASVAAQQISSEKAADTAQWWFWRDRDGIHVRVRHPHTDAAVALVGQVLDTTAHVVDTAVRQHGQSSLC